MPLNQIKKYNDLLDIVSLSVTQRKESLQLVFDRDIRDNPNFKFRNKVILPTPLNGEIEMSNLFTHLTTTIVDYKTKKREFDIHRSKRLHWVRFHVEEKKNENVIVFSTKEKNRFRTYIYDLDEDYVIVLEPLRNNDEYYLLTAYHVRGKDKERKKFLNKYKRCLPEVL